MQTSLKYKSIAIAVSLVLAMAGPQYGMAQRFNHSSFGGGRPAAPAPRQAAPAFRPAAPSRPAPAPSRPVEARPVEARPVEARPAEPAATINGGGRNIGNHDFSRPADVHTTVKVVVNELTTEGVIARLREGRIDVGILVTPLQENGIREQVLFYEELLVYVSRKNAAYKKTYMLAQDIDPSKLWLLEEGHCFRSQIVRLCELRKASKEGSHFDYEAGSLETLRRMVELNDGITILPELAATDLSSRQRQLIRHFKRPAPMREVSLVVHRDFVKQRLVQALKEEIIRSIPDKVRQNKNVNVIPI